MIMNAGGNVASEVMAIVGLKWLGGGSPTDGPTAGPSGGGGTQDAEGRKEKRDTSDTQKKSVGALQDINKKTSGYLRQTLGINIGIASILKQSQIFTGTLGTIFQILGALVDVILAPFLPIIVPAIKSMAENIPQIRAKAEQIVGTVVSVTKAIAKWINWLLDKLPGGIGKVIKDIVQYWILGLFLTKLLGVQSIYLAATKGVGVLLMKGLMMLLGAQKETTAATLASNGVYGGAANRASAMVPGGWQGGGGAAAGGRGRFNPMFGRHRIGVGGMAMAGTVAAGGLAYGASTGGLGGAAWSVGGMAVGGGIGFALAGPMGAAIGASAGSYLGPIIGGWISGIFDSDKNDRSSSDTYNRGLRNTGWYPSDNVQFKEPTRLG